MILTCSFLMPNDEECGERCEGNTPFCGSHNRFLRKEKELAEKALYKKASLLSKPKKVYAKPNKVSDKRKELNKEYFKLVEQFKKDNPECKAKVNEHCTTKTQDVHHKKGRSNHLFDVSTFLPVCRSCHTYIEHHPHEAKNRGWSESRLATQTPTI